VGKPSDGVSGDEGPNSFGVLAMMAISSIRDFQVEPSKEFSPRCYIRRNSSSPAMDITFSSNTILVQRDETTGEKRKIERKCWPTKRSSKIYTNAFSQDGTASRFRIVRDPPR
jgi:hypothetical protein